MNGTLGMRRSEVRTKDIKSGVIDMQMDFKTTRSRMKLPKE